ncbi:MAG TPA: type II toxin-antitoxin system VapC family toxin [Candidatus Limnocylindrales bacterium]|nr:type II toxin-antitoxin system VapC family toxin [Candidatus Limnocylindrales bacterium]
MILDTNALSAYADEQMSVFEALSTAKELALPVVVIGEYRYGIALSRRRDWYQKWLDEFVRDCRVLNIDEATTQHYADIRVELKRSGTPIPVHDVWIAALSRQHGLPVLSRDPHFDSVLRFSRVPW